MSVAAAAVAVGWMWLLGLINEVVFGGWVFAC